MMAFDALRRRKKLGGFGAISPMSMGANMNQLPGVPQLPMAFEGNYNPRGPYKTQPFNPMPFEGGMPGLGKGGMEGPFSGPFNVPAMMARFGGNYRRPGMMGLRQRY